MNKKTQQDVDYTPKPAGYIKIKEALKTLLTYKEFSSITWSEIANTAGVNEGLIYKYFKDKRNLLHVVLHEYLEEFVADLIHALGGIQGSLNKLRKIAWFQISLYNRRRVYPKAIFLEVRNYPGYYNSITYETVKRFSRIVSDVINEGIENGEIRNDIPPKSIRQIFLGAIEHICLPAVIFDKPMDPDSYTDAICKVIFSGIAKDTLDK